MTEEEAKEALFEINKDYMNHPPEERLKLYDEYIENRNRVKEQLNNYCLEEKLKEEKIK